MIFKVNDGVKLLPSIRQNFFYDFVPFSKFKVSIIDLYEVVRIKFKVRFESTKINFALMLWLHVIRPSYTMFSCNQFPFNKNFAFTETI